MPLITPPIKNIKELTEPLKEEILNGNVHTIDDMKAWLQPLGYSHAINEAAIKYIMREFVMSEVSTDNMMNMDMVVERLRPQLEVTNEDIERFVKPSDQSQTCLNYSMARKGRMKSNRSLLWACTITVTLLVLQVHL